MASEAKLEVVILWDNEIREAARLLHAWHDSPDKDSRPDLMADAFNACLVALWGVREGTGLVMLGSRDIERLARPSPEFMLEPSE